MRLASKSAPAQPRDMRSSFTDNGAAAPRHVSGFGADSDRVQDAPHAALPTSDDVLEKGGPIPRSIGRCADLYNDVRSLRLTMEKEVEKVKARETEVKEHIIANLSKSDDTGAAGLRYRAQIVMKDVPRAMDWAAVHKFIQTSGRFDLLQKRLGEKAVMDMVEQGEQIPGVEIVHVPDVSITKIAGR